MAALSAIIARFYAIVARAPFGDPKHVRFGVAGSAAGERYGPSGTANTWGTGTIHFEHEPSDMLHVT